MDQAIILPLMYGLSQNFVKPRVRRFPLSSQLDWFWKDVIVDPRRANQAKGEDRPDRHQLILVGSGSDVMEFA
ncbi:MAG: hypothetical protein WA996_08190 [Candidatus Promineifilaceae bacterium]